MAYSMQSWVIAERIIESINLCIVRAQCPSVKKGVTRDVRCGRKSKIRGEAVHEGRCVRGLSVG